jgi:hypothetical protein
MKNADSSHVGRAAVTFAGRLPKPMPPLAPDQASGGTPRRKGTPMECAYCERALICEACQTAFEPPTADDYVALSAKEETILCPACGEILVCHWCKTTYDGGSSDEPSESAPPPPG